MSLSSPLGAWILTGGFETSDAVHSTTANIGFVININILSDVFFLFGMIYKSALLHMQPFGSVSRQYYQNIWMKECFIDLSCKYSLILWNPNFHFSSDAFGTKPHINTRYFIHKLHIFFLSMCSSDGSRGLKQHASSASTCCMHRMWVILSSYTIITTTLYLHTSLKFPTCQCPIVYTRSSIAWTPACFQ